MTPGREGPAAVLRLYGLESLKQATRQNWPWWRREFGFNREWVSLDEWARQPPYIDVPYLPDFATDDAAAVQLLVKLSCSTEYLRVFPPSAPGEPWAAEDKGAMPGEGKTLGACVLDMLERYEEVPS